MKSCYYHNMRRLDWQRTKLKGLRGKHRAAAKEAIERFDLVIQTAYHDSQTSPEARKMARLTKLYTKRVDKALSDWRIGVIKIFPDMDPANLEWAKPGNWHPDNGLRKQVDEVIEKVYKEFADLIFQLHTEQRAQQRKVKLTDNLRKMVNTSVQQAGEKC